MLGMRQLVYDYVLDTTAWTGPNPTWNEVYTTRIIAVCLVGTLYAFVFKLLYVVSERLTYIFFPKYKTLNNMQKVDWTSRYPPPPRHIPPAPKFIQIRSTDEFNQIQFNSIYFNSKINSTKNHLIQFIFKFNSIHLSSPPPDLLDFR